MSQPSVFASLLAIYEATKPQFALITGIAFLDLPPTWEEQYEHECCRLPLADELPHEASA